MTDPKRQAAHPAASPRTPNDPAPAVSAGEFELPRLLQSAAAGDEDAWRSIVHLYARRIYALARSRLCGGGGIGGTGEGGAVRRIRSVSPDGLFVQGYDIAEEVTQSVFVTVASKLSSGEYTEQGRFESWLFRVAMNRIRDEVRRAKRQASPTDPEALDATGARATSAAEPAPAEELASLRTALGQLTDQDREVVELRHHAGLSFKQMSDLLAEPLGTLLARHHRALRKLKDLMTGHPGNSPGQPARTTGDAP